MAVRLAVREEVITCDAVRVAEPLRELVAEGVEDLVARCDCEGVRACDRVFEVDEDPVMLTVRVEVPDELDVRALEPLRDIVQLEVCDTERVNDCDDDCS